MTLTLRREGRTHAGELDLSCEPGLRTAWHTHAGELYGYACKALEDNAAAEEALQETFLRAWRSADIYDPERPLRPWLFAILRNVIIDEARARAARPTLHNGELTEQVAEDSDPLAQALDAWLIEEALRRIRPEHRTVIIETLYRGRPYRDVAADLGIPEGTARSRAFYGLRALRVALEELGWEG